ncbi:LysE family translocator [Opitutia bacterium ISCC 51]|nr:LysE family translocator [Opitutae bacterium ISCC 51]QXD26843.1 LysE family translocator [Opitutae bacterium ISCC 52]
MTQTLVILLVTQIFAMMSPGPDMLLIIRNTLGTAGKQTAFFTILGIAAGLTVHISVSIAGLAIVLSQSDLLYSIVRYLGAAYLAYIGLKSLLNRSQFKIQSGENTDLEKSNSEAFREGFFTNLLNPKVTLYILSLFTQLIAPASPIWQKLIYGSVLVIEAMAVWLIFSAIIGIPIIRRLTQEWALWIDRLFGLMLIAIALSVVLVK